LKEDESTAKSPWWSDVMELLVGPVTVKQQEIDGSILAFGRKLSREWDVTSWNCCRTTGEVHIHEYMIDWLCRGSLFLIWALAGPNFVL